MTKYNLIVIFALFAAAILYQISQPTPVTAGSFQVAAAISTVNPADAAKGIPLTWDSVIKLLYRFTCWIITLLEAVFVIFIVWTGLKFMWARGDPTATSAAGKSLLYLLIGGVVLFSFNIIIATARYYSDQVPGTSSKINIHYSSGCISF